MMFCGDRNQWLSSAWLACERAGWGVAVAIVLSLVSGGLAAELGESVITAAIDVAPVWSGHPVQFALLTSPPRQYVAFYDAERRLTVGCRELDSSSWQLVRLPTAVGWDSHNYVTMVLDDDGHLHVSGNMHCVPLIYFRTTRPHDVASLEPVPSMVGRNESRCTYPRFLRGAAGELLFTYRDGRSGNGEQIWNVYDLPSQTWRRLLDKPLFSGGGQRNAYFHGPIRDREGMFHICWVWREDPDCATNHDLCYARSKDLVHWETSTGEPLALPITLETAEIVDPVPIGGGIINGNTVIGFDSDARPIISYHKFDAAGNTQLYSARREADGWKIYQTSDWDYRWDFSGGGSIGFEIGFGPVTAGESGLTQSFRHAKLGSGVWRLDEATLRPTGRTPQTVRLPRELVRVESKHPRMGVRMAEDLGTSGEQGVRYLLRWETQPSNRDRAWLGEPPSPSMLRVYRISEQG